MKSIKEFLKQKPPKMLVIFICLSFIVLPILTLNRVVKDSLALSQTSLSVDFILTFSISIALRIIYALYGVIVSSIIIRKVRNVLGLINSYIFVLFSYPFVIISPMVIRDIINSTPILAYFDILMMMTPFFLLYCSFWFLYFNYSKAKSFVR